MLLSHKKEWNNATGNNMNASRDYHPKYQRRCPENPKPQDGKETEAADPPAENSSAPEAEQGGAE